MTDVGSRVEYREALPPAGEFVRLFRTTGWTTALPDDRLVAALAGTWHCVCAYADGGLVGMGRTISDGGLHALIVEVIVDPAWQRRGVGSEVMRRIVAKCRDEGIDQIQLFCAEGKRPFYERLGFEARPEDAPGMQLVETAEPA